MKCLPKPCPTCPWRVDQHADEIPNFSLDLAEALANTCDPSIPLWGGAIFACHQSNEGGEFPCAGWLAVYGYQSVRVRVLVTLGQIPEHAVVGVVPDDWPELHASYDDVLAKLRNDVLLSPVQTSNKEVQRGNTR